MNIGRALTYLTEDPQWVRKLAIAMLLNLLPTAFLALSFAAMYGKFPARVTLTTTSAIWARVSLLAGVPLLGFGLCSMRNVIAGHDVPLPDWSDWRGLLRDGLMVWGVITIWYLPSNFLDWLGKANPHVADSLSQLSSVLTLLASLAMPAAQARLAVTGRFRAGLDVGAVLQLMQSNFGGYLRLLIVTGLGTLVISIPFVFAAWLVTGSIADRGSRLLATILLGMGLAILILRPYGELVLNHLMGQVYLKAVSRRPNS